MTVQKPLKALHLLHFIKILLDSHSKIPQGNFFLYDLTKKKYERTMNTHNIPVCHDTYVFLLLIYIRCSDEAHPMLMFFITPPYI